MSDQSDDMSDQMLVWPDIMSDHFKKGIIVSEVYIIIEKSFSGLDESKY